MVFYAILLFLPVNGEQKLLIPLNSPLHYSCWYHRRSSGDSCRISSRFSPVVVNSVHATRNDCDGIAYTYYTYRVAQNS